MGAISRAEEKALEKVLRQLGTRPIPARIENRPQPGPSVFHQRPNIRTNIFQVEVTKKTTLYKYKLKITGHRDAVGDEAPKLVEFTNAGESEFYNVERRRVCTRLFNAFVRIHQDEWLEREQMYYDQRSTIFTTKKLDFAEDWTEIITREQAFPGQDDEIDLNAELRGATRFEFTIEFDGPEFNNILAETLVDDNIDDFEYDFVRFLDVASMQEVVVRPEEYVTFAKSTAYYFDPMQHNEGETEVFPGGVYIAAGLQKTTRVIEGSGSKLSIVVSPKYSLFYTVQTLTEKFADFNNDLAMFGKFVKGAYIMPLHLLERAEYPKMIFAQVVEVMLSAQEVTFETSDDRKISVADYFAQTYPDLQLDGRAPVACCRQGKNKVYYPFEVCMVCDNVRLSSDNASVRDYVASLIRKAAILPNALQNRVMDAFNALRLVNSGFMANAGIRVESRPIDTYASTLQAPLISYANNAGNFETANSGWRTRGMRYADGANSVPWVCYAAVRGARFTIQNLNEFGNAFLQECGFRGVRLGDPSDVSVLEVDNDQSSDVPALKKALYDAYTEGGCKFALIITNKADISVHAALKTYEQMFGIVTQNVTHKIAISVAVPPTQRRGQTLENIVNKTNVKLGGLNYRLQHSQTRREMGEDDLFIGFALNQVAGGFSAEKKEKEREKRRKEAEKAGKSYGTDDEDESSAPNILGFAANDIEQPIGFTGDFLYYTASRVELLSAFDTALQRVFARYLAVHGKKSPARVFIYCNGFSEGELKNVVSYEVPLFRKAIETSFGNQAKLMLILSNKMHNVRFTPIEISPQARSACDMNILPGTVIDKQVVHPTFPEFYLASTKALQGSTKVPRYSVLCNDAGMNMPDIEQMTFELCFGHQIIPLSTGLPTPIYVAEEYAKRGRSLYNAGLRIRPEMSKEPEYLNNNLVYDPLEMRGQRVNA